MKEMSNSGCLRANGPIESQHRKFSRQLETHLTGGWGDLEMSKTI